MMRLKLDPVGPAEPTRLALTIGGVAFEDVRVDREAMLALRADGALKGGGQLPQLEVDGAVLSQSQAQTTFAGKLAGLYPADPWLAARVDEVTQLVNQDIRDRCIAPTMREPDADKKAALRKELAEEKLPAKFALLEALLQPSGYYVGDAVTLADLHVYVLCNWIGMEVLDGVPASCVTPALRAHCATLNNHPKIAAWNAANNAGKVPWF
jgi:glutathione S-transferase